MRILSWEVSDIRLPLKPGGPWREESRRGQRGRYVTAGPRPVKRPTGAAAAMIPVFRCYLGLFTGSCCLPHFAPVVTHH